jgi:hypothetical protein
MDPLDLTVRPPRSPYEMLEGLYMMPRTIDKLRAKLRGGSIGTYTIRGSSTLLPGLSLVLLDGIGLTEENLYAAVERAADEETVAEWLRENADLSDIDGVNDKLFGRRIADFLALVPMEKAEKIYPAMRYMPVATRAFDLLLADDRSAMQ